MVQLPGDSVRQDPGVAQACLVGAATEISGQLLSGLRMGIVVGQVLLDFDRGRPDLDVDPATAADVGFQDDEILLSRSSSPSSRSPRMSD